MKPSHPTITLELLEIALNSVTAEHRSQVATAHGVVPNLLHMVRMEAQKSQLVNFRKADPFPLTELGKCPEVRMVQGTLNF
jgi:transposase-like protein